MRKTIFAAMALAMLAVPAMASAADAWTRSAVNLRTGPDADYPRIATLRAGQSVQVHGCINDWSWCDVSARGNRGWVSASFLEQDYRGRRVQVSRNGPSLGLSVLSFTLGTYWDQHYRGKSWYAQRERMAQRHPQHAAPSKGKGQGTAAANGQPHGNQHGQDASPSRTQSQAQPAQPRQDDRDDRGHRDEKGQDKARDKPQRPR